MLVFQSKMSENMNSDSWSVRNVAILSFPLEAHQFNQRRHTTSNSGPCMSHSFRQIFTLAAETFHQSSSQAWLRMKLQRVMVFNINQYAWIDKLASWKPKPLHCITLSPKVQDEHVFIINFMIWMTETHAELSTPKMLHKASICFFQMC